MSKLWTYQLRGVTKSYGGRQVLSIDRLDVPGGETLCLVGPTGAGKSTLLRLLAALEPPTTGSLHSGGHPLHGPGLPLAARRRMTMDFQRPLLLTGTVQANVEYGLRMRGVGRRAARDQALAALERLGLAGLSESPARTLSTGQAQLVALSAALVLETDALLLDEPTANLDPANVARVEEVVCETQRRRGTTVVWATHNLFQARRLAVRAALLLEGRLVEVAPATSFFTSPADPRTAAFVRGEMIY
jgi:tungstate transport system ATP-binding protein